LSVSHSLSNSCAYTWKINPPKKKSRQKQTVETPENKDTHTRQKLTDEPPKKITLQTNKIPPNKNQKQNPAVPPAPPEALESF
jgi:hypothetical protein